MENDPHTPGAKLDAGKPLAALVGDFGLALLEVARVGTHGVEKYTRHGWEKVTNGKQRYRDAMWRHMLIESQEQNDPDSGLRHAAHAAWNALAALELELRVPKKLVLTYVCAYCGAAVARTAGESPGSGEGLGLCASCYSKGV